MKKLFPIAMGVVSATCMVHVVDLEAITFGTKIATVLALDVLGK